ncbi:MAG TPA: radical SAM protein, partial [Terriglobia bacterium]|nr:radical SAM protein [Terriglobia bacterium]
EASRGCKHLCRHCPVVPVYGGRFRIVDRDVVLEDIRRQVEAGAQHITFGDPDFFNGIRHAIDVVTALHASHPALTYDVTIKVEHLLTHSEHLRTLGETACLFVTSAVEAVDDAVLERLDKGHTYADFVAVVDLCRASRLVLSPTFVAFTPWTTLRSYVDLLRCIAQLGLIENVAPIQLAIRLLIPAGSRLLELREVREMVGAFDESSLVYPWSNADPRVDQLCIAIQRLIAHAQTRGHSQDKSGWSRGSMFERIWELAYQAAGLRLETIPQKDVGVARAAIPYLTEPWYC